MPIGWQWPNDSTSLRDNPYSRALARYFLLPRPPPFSSFFCFLLYMSIYHRIVYSKFVLILIVNRFSILYVSICYYHYMGVDGDGSVCMYFVTAACTWLDHSSSFCRWVWILICIDIYPKLIWKKCIMVLDYRVNVVNLVGRGLQLQVEVCLVNIKDYLVCKGLSSRGQLSE